MGVEETGGTGVSHAVGTGAARQRALQLMRGEFKIKCLSAGSGWREGGREAGLTAQRSGSRNVRWKKTKLTTNDLPSYPRTASLEGVKG